MTMPPGWRRQWRLRVCEVEIDGHRKRRARSGRMIEFRMSGSCFTWGGQSDNPQFLNAEWEGELVAMTRISVIQ